MKIIDRLMSFVWPKCDFSLSKSPVKKFDPGVAGMLMDVLQAMLDDPARNRMNAHQILCLRRKIAVYRIDAVVDRS